MADIECPLCDWTHAREADRYAASNTAAAPAVAAAMGLPADALLSIHAQQGEHRDEQAISNDAAPVVTRDGTGSLKVGTGLGLPSAPAVATATAVRRLTPLECERLQGFPDGWTATSNGKPQSDSARYRQLGNAVAVPCVEWIAHRIAAVGATS